MNTFLIFAIVVLLMQVGIFLMIRKKKKGLKQNSVLEKYNIRSAADAFRLIQDTSIPQEDRDKIEQLYKGEDQ